MREWIYGRNPVYEVLKAGRRGSFQLLIAQGTQIKDRVADILKLVKGERLPVEQVPRSKLDRIHTHHQGVALEASSYPYAALPDMLHLAEERDESPLLLILDTLQVRIVKVDFFIECIGGFFRLFQNGYHKRDL
jgi:23S rRNA (guanosine2251-2'-O)-methyltransferase